MGNHPAPAAHVAAYERHGGHLRVRVNHGTLTLARGQGRAAGSPWYGGDRLDLDESSRNGQSGDDGYGDRRWIRPLPPHLAEGLEALGDGVLVDDQDRPLDDVLDRGTCRAQAGICAAEDCGLLFVDASRPGQRRWCSMERCGNLAKVRGHRARAT